MTSSGGVPFLALVHWSSKHGRFVTIERIYSRRGWTPFVRVPLAVLAMLLTTRSPA